jgi:hypothetical protein
MNTAAGKLIYSQYISKSNDDIPLVPAVVSDITGPLFGKRIINVSQLVYKEHAFVRSDKYIREMRMYSDCMKNIKAHVITGLESSDPRQTQYRLNYEYLMKRRAGIIYMKWEPRPIEQSVYVEFNAAVIIIDVTGKSKELSSYRSNNCAYGSYITMLDRIPMGFTVYTPATCPFTINCRNSGVFKQSEDSKIIVMNQPNGNLKELLDLTADISEVIERIQEDANNATTAFATQQKEIEILGNENIRLTRLVICNSPLPYLDQVRDGTHLTRTITECGNWSKWWVHELASI